MPYIHLQGLESHLQSWLLMPPHPPPYGAVPCGSHQSLRWSLSPPLTVKPPSLTPSLPPTTTDRCSAMPSEVWNICQLVHAWNLLILVWSMHKLSGFLSLSLTHLHTCTCIHVYICMHTHSIHICRTPQHSFVWLVKQVQPSQVKNRHIWDKRQPSRRTRKPE